jgi:rubredoxin
VLAASPEQDDRRGGTGGSGCLRAHSDDDNLRPMGAETQIKQLWVCTSCGFIYDPDDGDPDGGIPPGTPFDEIPDTWFCPVCGARKADFEPYEE